MPKLLHLISLALAFWLGLCCQQLVPEAQAGDLKRVTGVSGIFFKSRDPAALKKWYSRHLGLNMDQYGTNFVWRTVDGRRAQTQWSAFAANTTYFEPSSASFMINYRVADLESLIPILKSEGVTLVDQLDVQSYGKFLHILDPEGNKIELFEPTGEYPEGDQGRTY